MNGQSIEIDNTDAEGRLILSDAIYHGSTEFNAHTLIDVASLTGSRMTLDDAYAPQITACNADLCNVGVKGAGACTAALFLKSFVEGVDPVDGEASPRVRCAHIDIVGSMEVSRGSAYQDAGMAGRPTQCVSTGLSVSNSV
ncbi:hypothetical protein C8Q80DRAFT_1222074 [Daedaleopsis nitida]|nr:hypothetical protein C8Q80DRAFT_1222074 [Daedaleopsis nitida]